MTDPYPLLLRPVLMPKVWGGDRLARFGKAVKSGEKIGESWELADLGATSASGAGGGAVRSVIENGPLAGKTIHDAIALWGDAMLPRAALTKDGNFPLLIKFLDAQENLSVQVHPSPAYAAAHPEAHLKTECWYVLDAAPGSVIYKGVKPGVTRAVFERALRSGDGSGVVALMEAVPAMVGECHNLPSGTVHALGAGVLVAEVQTPSDTTFRVYDWGRSGRELHIEQAMECIEWGQAPGAVEAAAMRAEGLRTEFFGVTVVESKNLVTVLPGTICVVLEGEASSAELRVSRGQTVFVPGTGGAQQLRNSSVPNQLKALVVVPREINAH